MKKSIFSIVLFFSIVFYNYAQSLSPYVKVGVSNKSINVIADQVSAALKSNGYTVLGLYNPSGKAQLKVIAFTRKDLKDKVIKVKDRGALAAIFKVGLEQKNGKVIVSYTNPEYVLRAYLMDNYSTDSSTYTKFSKDLKSTLSSFGNEFSSFGGSVKVKDLKKYHYKIFMPYYTDPIELATYSSFEQGLAKIQANLNAKKGQTKLVYQLLYKKEKVAVFGVGLSSKEDGEAHFLPIIGEAHVAALPYEIILQDKVASMLHGKYRIALHWPELTMGTFMKIMSTPGDIESALEAVCE